MLNNSLFFVLNLTLRKKSTSKNCVHGRPNPQKLNWKFVHLQKFRWNQEHFFCPWTRWGYRLFFGPVLIKGGLEKSLKCNKCGCVGGGRGGWNFILLRPKFRCLMQNLLKKVLYKLLDGEVVKIRKQIKTKFTFH